MKPTPITNEVTTAQLSIFEGDEVEVERDDGKVEVREALSVPRMIGGTLCVKVAGLGYFALSRVTPTWKGGDR
jgi:hypothetical protein